MRSSIARMSIALMAISSYGCASSLRVTYNSDPQGAVFYEGGRSLGYTPVTLNYQITPEAEKRGYVLMRETSVSWASGAKASIKQLRASLSAGLNHQFTFRRPENVPGREADMRFALEVERNRIMRAQAQAQQDQALWQMYNALQQQNRTYNCTSMDLGGGMISTQCR